MGHKGWRKDGKTFIKCYTIALKFWVEFNANFVIIFFKLKLNKNVTPLSQKCGEKKEGGALKVDPHLSFLKPFQY